MLWLIRTLFQCYHCVHCCDAIGLLRWRCPITTLWRRFFLTAATFHEEAKLTVALNSEELLNDKRKWRSSVTMRNFGNEVQGSRKVVCGGNCHWSFHWNEAKSDITCKVGSHTIPADGASIMLMLYWSHNKAPCDSIGLPSIGWTGRISQSWDYGTGSARVSHAIRRVTIRSAVGQV